LAGELTFIAGPSPAKLPAKKRKVNRRSTRSSYLSLSQQTETSAEPEHVRSPSSVDLDAPIPTQDVEEVAAMTEEITSIAKAVKESEAAATAQTEEDIPMADDRQKEITQPTEKVPTSDENLKINDPSTDTPDASGMENVAETTFDESSWEGISDLAKAEDAPREEGAPADKEDMLDPIDSTTEMAALQGGTVSEKEVEVEVEVEREVEREVEGEVEGEAEIPTAQSMKSKLESLISDLASAVLTRGELHVFEDMFMDAKEMLYGAGRRGRDRE
jgi:hypothetical protein